MSAFRTYLLLLLLSAGGGLVRAQTSPTLIGSTSNLTVTAGSSLPAIDLSTIFGLPSVSATATVVQLQTNLGPINFLLDPTDAPATVANFLTYVNSGAYNNSIIHRGVPGFVIQGGGYTVASGSVNPTAIPQNAPVVNEYKVSNTYGTVAMAKLSTGVNTATNQWFINLADNSGNLNNQNGGFTVFATVMGSGMTVANKIGALPDVQVPNLDTTIFNAVPAYNYSLAAGFTYANWVILPKVAVIPVYPSGTGATSVLTFTAASTNPAAVSASVNGKILAMTGVAPGSASVTVSAIDSNGSQVSAVYNVTVAAAFAITQQPTAESVNSGSTAVLSVAASPSAGATYQWLFNGAAITTASNSSATSSHLVVSPASAANAGTYNVVVTGANGTVLTSNAVALTVASTTAVGRLTNLSVLTSDIAAAQALTLGFVVGPGTPALPLLLRASGPALSAFSIANYIPDPTINLFTTVNGTPTVLGTNRGWSSTTANQNAVAAAQTETGAFAFAVGSADSALVESLTPGNYSIVIQSFTNQSGATLGEVFDASGGFTSSNSHLINLSSRLAVGTGHTLTGGFYITGNTARTVLIRGVGPTLGSFGLSGLMPDPALTLFNATGTQLATNTGWGGDSQIAAEAAVVSAFALPAASADSAILITLPPGGYSAQVTSAGGGGGNALVEVYEVP